MNNKKRILISSVLTIVLCAMLGIGATFALFTSESQVDVSISSGKVDVNAVVENVELYSPAAINLDGTIEDATNSAVDGVFGNGGTVSVTEGNLVTFERMTPGDKVSFDVVVKNESDVTVKYQTKVELVEGIELFAGLRITLQKDEEILVYDGMTSVSEWAVLSSEGEVERTTVTVELPTTAGNEFQGLTCKISFKVNAVQGNSVVTEVEEGVVYLYNATDLILFEKSVNNSGKSYVGKTVVLMDDVDLDGINWIPVGQTGNTTFLGIFDGQNHTISNMTINNTDEGGNSATGFFGWIENTSGAVVKNINFENASVTGNHNVGVVAGWVSGTIENCKVNNSTVIANNVNDDANGDKVGAIVGLANAGVINNNAVTNTTITGNRDMGGVVGAVISGTTFTNNSVSDLVITYQTVRSYASAGALVSGRTGLVPDETNTSNNVTIVLAALVSTADQFTTALKENVDEIYVTLANDLTVAIANLGVSGVGGVNRLGGENTQVIDIDLNGKSLLLESTYMLALGALNESATITVQNGTMEGTTTDAQTWNIADLMFNDCDWILDNVVFNSPVAINNEGKTVTMNNVTINIATDLYAIWVCAGTELFMDGCTVNSAGRAIKISDQYVAKEDRTLTKLTVKNTEFNSVKKAAILVGSTAGATIELTNVDISGCQTDATNAVWVDNGSQDTIGSNTGGEGNELYSDYASLVTVTGGTKIIEP